MEVRSATKRNGVDRGKNVEQKHAREVITNGL